MAVVRCKMKLTALDRQDYSGEVGYQIKLEVVAPYDKADITPEDHDFFKWTPSGFLSFGTVNPHAAEALTPGKSYYVDLIPAE